MLDARTFMLMKALDDFAKNNASAEESSLHLSNTGVDWDHYMGLYREAQKQQDETPTAPAEGEHPEGAVVFGGGG